MRGGNSKIFLRRERDKNMAQNMHRSLHSLPHIWKGAEVLFIFREERGCGDNLRLLRLVLTPPLMLPVVFPPLTEI